MIKKNNINNVNNINIEIENNINESEEKTVKNETVSVEDIKNMVKNNKSDIYLIFYAPWCGHCTKLKEMHLKLNKKNMKNDNGVFLFFNSDETLDEIFSFFNVNAYPTIVKINSNIDNILFKNHDVKTILEKINV